MDLDPETRHARSRLLSTPVVSRIGAGCAIPLALAKKAVIAKQAGIERTSRCLGSICSPMRGLYKASRCPKGYELEHRKIAKMGCPRSHAMFTGLDGHPS